MTPNFHGIRTLAKAKATGEGMARSARLGAWLGENLHVLNPVLFLYTKAMPKLITPLYNAFGVPGLVALPWVMLSLEKVAYDTFTAARGHDMYTEAQETGQNPHGEFPSGGGRSWFEMAHLWPRWRQRRPQSPTSPASPRAQGVPGLPRSAARVAQQPRVAPHSPPASTLLQRLASPSIQQAPNCRPFR